MRGPHFRKIIVCQCSAASSDRRCPWAVAIFYRQINHLTNIIKALQDIRIGKTQYFQTKCSQITGSKAVMFHSFRIIVLRTIQFHYQSGFCAIEIHDIPINHTLPSELYGVMPQKIIPKQVLFLGCVFTELLGVLFQFFVLFHRHSCSTRESPHPALRATFPPGGRFYGMILFFFKYLSSSENTQPQYFWI